MFEVELYETEDGKEPVADFLDSLEPKVKLIGSDCHEIKGL